MLVDFDERRKDELTALMSQELVALRAKSGVSQEELSKRIGISRQTYSAIETKKRKMSWSTYLALLLFFDYNPLTHDMLRSLNVFPDELQIITELEPLVIDQIPRCDEEDKNEVQ